MKISKLIIICLFISFGCSNIPPEDLNKEVFFAFNQVLFRDAISEISVEYGVKIIIEERLNKVANLAIDRHSWDNEGKVKLHEALDYLKSYLKKHHGIKIEWSLSKSHVYVYFVGNEDEFSELPLRDPPVPYDDDFFK